MPDHNANELVDEILVSCLSRFQSGLETSMRGSDFIFDSVQRLYYKCNKINFKCGGSYVDSPDRIKMNKAIINRKNNDSDDDDDDDDDDMMIDVFNMQQQLR